MIGLAEIHVADSSRSADLGWREARGEIQRVLGNCSRKVLTKVACDNRRDRRCYSSGKRGWVQTNGDTSGQSVNRPAPTLFEKGEAEIGGINPQ